MRERILKPEPRADRGKLTELTWDGQALQFAFLGLVSLRPSAHLPTDGVQPVSSVPSQTSPGLGRIEEDQYFLFATA